jgi:hypothetical protein
MRATTSIEVGNKEERIQERIPEVEGNPTHWSLFSASGDLCLHIHHYLSPSCSTSKCKADLYGSSDSIWSMGGTSKKWARV